MTVRLATRADAAALAGVVAALRARGLATFRGAGVGALAPALAFALALGLPPPRAARASIRVTASSSVIVSGVLSDGSVALMPSWLA